MFCLAGDGRTTSETSIVYYGNHAGPIRSHLTVRTYLHAAIPGLMVYLLWIYERIYQYGHPRENIIVTRVTSGINKPRVFTGEEHIEFGHLQQAVMLPTVSRKGSSWSEKVRGSVTVWKNQMLLLVPQNPIALFRASICTHWAQLSHPLLPSPPLR